MTAPIKITRTEKETDDAITVLETSGTFDLSIDKLLPTRTVLNTNKYNRIVARQNYLLYSESLDQVPPWEKSNLAANPTISTIDSLEINPDTGTFVKYWELIGNAADTQKYFRQLAPLVSSRGVFSVRLRAGAQGLALIQFFSSTTGTVRFAVDLATGELGNFAGMTANDVYVKIVGDDVHIKAVTGTGTSGEYCYIFPIPAFGDFDYAGDGSTVDLYVAAPYFYEGELIDSIDYAPTTDTISETVELEPVDDKQKNWDLDLLQRRDDLSWEIKQSPLALSQTIVRDYFPRPITEIELPTWACLGDSRTDGGGGLYAYANTLNEKHSSPVSGVQFRNFVNLGVGGIHATQMVRYQLIQAIGQLRYFFRTSYYPWSTAGTITIAIDGATETLELLQPATPSTDYMYLHCLAADQEVTISGYYSTINSSRLRVATTNGGTILDTASDGDFSVNYTPSANEEQVRLTSLGGTLGDAIYIRDLKIELTDKSACANNGAIINSGINDVIGGNSVATIIDALFHAASQCRQAGIKPTFVGVFAFGNYTGWDGTKETVRTTVNTDLAASDYGFISTTFLESGSPPVIRSQWDSGDGLHLNELGYVEEAMLINAGLFG